MREVRQRGQNFFDGKRNSNDACRADENLLRSTFERARSDFRGGARCAHSAGAIGAIRVPGIHDHGADMRGGFFQVVLAEQNGRGLDEIRGEDACDGGGSFGDDDREIETILAAQSARGGRIAKSLWQISRGNRAGNIHWIKRCNRCGCGGRCSFQVRAPECVSLVRQPETAARTASGEVPPGTLCAASEPSRLSAV